MGRPLLAYNDPEETALNELIFVVEEAPEGGYTARALGESIFTEADDLAHLQDQVRDAVLCHFDQEAARPTVVRLHFVRGEGDLIGCVSGGPPDLSEETGKKFHQLLTRTQDPR